MVAQSVCVAEKLSQHKKGGPNASKEKFAQGLTETLEERFDDFGLHVRSAVSLLKPDWLAMMLLNDRLRRELLNQGVRLEDDRSLTLRTLLFMVNGKSIADKENLNNNGQEIIENAQKNRKLAKRNKYGEDFFISHLFY